MQSALSEFNRKYICILTKQQNNSAKDSYRDTCEALNFVHYAGYIQDDICELQITGKKNSGNSDLYVVHLFLPPLRIIRLSRGVFFNKFDNRSIFHRKNAVNHICSFTTTVFKMFLKSYHFELTVPSMWKRLY